MDDYKGKYSEAEYEAIIEHLASRVSDLWTAPSSKRMPDGGPGHYLPEFIRPGCQFVQHLGCEQRKRKSEICSNTIPEYYDPTDSKYAQAWPSFVRVWGTRLEHEDDGSSVRKRPAGESAPVALPARKRRRGDKSRKNSLRYGGESYETKNQFVENETKSSAKRANLRKRLKGLRPAESNCILTRALSAFNLSKLHASWLKGKPDVHGEARISLLSQGDQPTKQDAVFVVSRLCALSLCKWCCVFNKRYQRRRAGWYWNAAGQRVFWQMRILAWTKQIEEATRHNACSHRGP